VTCKSVVKLFHVNVALCTGVVISWLDRSRISFLFRVVVYDGFCSDVRHYCLYESQLCSHDNCCWRTKGVVVFTYAIRVFVNC